jgi:hypothetical protein
MLLPISCNTLAPPSSTQPRAIHPLEIPDRDGASSSLTGLATTLVSLNQCIIGVKSKEE